MCAYMFLMAPQTLIAWLLSTYQLQLTAPGLINDASPGVSSCCKDLKQLLELVSPTLSSSLPLLLPHLLHTC